MATASTTAATTERTEHPHIVKTPGVIGGAARIDGTRISVQLLYAYVEAGQGVAEIRDAYPELTLAQIHDALSYAYDHPEEIAAERDRHRLRNVLKEHGGYYYRGWFLNRQQLEEKGLVGNPEVYTWETLPPELDE